MTHVALYRRIGVQCLAIYISLFGWSSKRHNEPLLAGAPEPATVTFHVVDSYGKPLKYKVESFRDIDTNVDMAKDFSGLTFESAVRGRKYKFRIAPFREYQNFPAFSDEVTLYDQSNFIFFSAPETIILPDRLTEEPPTRVVVKPVPASGSGPTWATARSVFLPNINDPGPETVEVIHGEFVLHGPHGGRYIITVSQDDKILGIGLMDIPLVAPSQPLELNLAPPPPINQSAGKKGTSMIGKRQGKAEISLHSTEEDSQARI